METHQKGATVVFGATGGIGSEVCRNLTDRDVKVVPVARNEERLKQLSGRLGCKWHSVDTRDFSAVENVLKDIADAQGGVEGVVNCVGSLLLKPAHLCKPSEWEETISSNLGSAFAVVRAAVPLMRRKGGSIVLFSSAAARYGMGNHEAIAAAKAGVIGLALSAAASYARYRIRINVVAPGMVRTPLSESILSSSATEKASESMHPLGRLGDPADIASAVGWFLDPAQSWVTGQVLGVDGGLAALRSSGGR